MFVCYVQSDLGRSYFVRKAFIQKSNNVRKNKNGVEIHDKKQQNFPNIKTQQKLADIRKKKS